MTGDRTAKEKGAMVHRAGVGDQLEEAVADPTQAAPLPCHRLTPPLFELERKRDETKDSEEFRRLSKRTFVLVLEHVFKNC